MYEEYNGPTVSGKRSKFGEMYELGMSPADSPSKVDIISLGREGGRRKKIKINILITSCQWPEDGWSGLGGQLCASGTYHLPGLGDERKENSPILFKNFPRNYFQ